MKDKLDREINVGDLVGIVDNHLYIGIVKKINPKSIRYTILVNPANSETSKVTMKSIKTFNVKESLDTFNCYTTDTRVIILLKNYEKLLKS